MMVALPQDNYVKLPIIETVLRGINIKVSIVGTHRDVEDVFKLHTLGRARVLRQTRPLADRLTGAATLLGGGEVRPRGWTHNLDGNAYSSSQSQRSRCSRFRRQGATPAISGPWRCMGAAPAWRRLVVSLTARRSTGTAR